MKEEYQNLQKKTPKAINPTSGSVSQSQGQFSSSVA